PSYPIDFKVYTTLERTIVPVSIPSTSPVLYPYQVSNYSEYGYGAWQFGEGLRYEKRLDLMPDGYTTTPVTNTAQLLRFFSMSDIHITDKETPAQGIYAGYKGGNPSGYSAVMLSTTQVLDAAVQTVNALHKQKPFDFGIFLGDAINNNQHNELRWYIDVLDGKMINPDSGTKDDPVPGPHNDYQDEYKAAGLDKSIKWYQALGNHDQFWMGTNVPNDYLKQTFLGENILNLGDQFNNPLVLDSRGFYMGSIDGRTQYGDVIGAGPVTDFAETPKVLAADPNRRAISRSEWMGEFFTTTSNPKGHGFNLTDVATGFACYSFEPKTDIPIKVIVLDDTQRDTDPNVGPYMYASIDTTRYDWLVNELDKGQAEGKLMIIAAHIPIRNEPVNSSKLWTTISPVSEQKLVEKLHTYPNLILWISGHVHRNTVTAFKSPDTTRPELGFWEVETASLRDFPQQFRMYDIVRNSDNTVSVFATDVDPSVRDGSIAAQSRLYAVATQQIFNATIVPTPSGAYNAELVKQLTPEMQVKIQNYGTSIDR
ncbi:MAG: TIGR03768 family metallophosphoesterase, partial [Methanoregula sp.]|nr:TIGR03768 family metallophosphoesterase [Methanoregula sp.]